MADDGKASDDVLRMAGRWVLAAFLMFAGVGHLINTDEFLAQVPPQFPAREAIVIVSGFVEIAFALSLAFWRRRRAAVGWALAAFFVVIFPGNIAQLLTGTDAFGLDSDLARAVRLLFQPVLVVWALWCTGAWRAWRLRQTERLRHTNETS